MFCNLGNIKVFCRVRPPFEDEGPSVVEFPDEFTVRIDTGDDSRTNSKKDYEFDRVFGPHIGQGVPRLTSNPVLAAFILTCGTLSLFF